MNIVNNYKPNKEGTSILSIDYDPLEDTLYVASGDGNSRTLTLPVLSVWGSLWVNVDMLLEFVRTPLCSIIIDTIREGCVLQHDEDGQELSLTYEADRAHANLMSLVDNYFDTFASTTQKINI